MSDVDDVVKEFLVESHENMDQLDRDLVALEKEPGSREILARVFRTIHTIKGTCGFLGFSRLESVTHVGESLLSRMRDGELQLSPDITSALLCMVDAVRKMLAHIESAGRDGDTNYAPLIDRLASAQKPRPAAAPGAAPLPGPGPTTRPCRDPAAASSPPPVGVEAPAPAEVVETRALGVSDSTIRVDVGLLDKLMNLVGELVLARNQILQYTATQKDTTFIATTQRLNLITTELQEGVMKTRMQPIGNVWGKFPRMVRDVALLCGKQVRLEMEGNETELDKTIIEAIKDPLTHVIRNSIDHGIEAQEVRAAHGKSPAGRIHLRAFHEGGQVNIEISDDGAGIDPEKVKQRAMQRGLLGPEQCARLNDRDAMNLIFLPGISTADRVTNVSGRGVGMDVVKTNIEKIGGTVDIHSKPHQGTTLKIKIPLTLAIIPALIVTSGGDRYAIPQVSLLELVRLESERAGRGIEEIHGVPVYRLRGNLLPVLYLSRELLVEDRPPAGAAESTINIVVLQAGDRPFGLVVENINDTEEIVVKPLGPQLKGNPCFAGATIMGDGRVALILDVLGIAQRANVVSEVRDRALVDKTIKAQERHDDRQTLLLFASQSGRMAIPLAIVARLEEFQKAAIERAGDQEVVQYRDQILPLIHLPRVLAHESAVDNEADADEDSDKIQVVVYSGQSRSSIGLVVDRILDIVEENLTVQLPGSRPGILSSAVIQGRVTEVLDIEGVIRAANPGFFDRSAPREARRLTRDESGPNGPFLRTTNGALPVDGAKP